MEINRHTVISLGIIFVTSNVSADVSFAPPTIIETPGAGADVLVLDLDGDGDLDIATLEVEFQFVMGQAVGFVNTLFNDGDGNFSGLRTFELGTFPALEFAFLRLVEADIDGDGRNAVQRVQDVNPGVTLKTVRDFAFSGTEHLDRFVDDLRKAGLPE